VIFVGIIKPGNLVHLNMQKGSYEKVSIKTTNSDVS